MDGATVRLRRRMLQKAAQDETLVAYALALCARARGLSPMDLCEPLRCDEHSFFRLGLCRRPREEGVAFRREVDRIATFAGVDPGALANLLREASFLQALQAGSRGSGRVLWAARERDDRFGPQSRSAEHDPQGRRDRGSEPGDGA